VTEQAHDPVGRRLRSMGDRYRGHLADVAAVAVDEGGGSLEPARDGAVAVSWADLGDRLVVQVHAPGGGGRFDTPGRTTEDADLVEALVDAVVAGRASGLTARHHARVELRLASGVISDGDAAGWPRRATRVNFRAYRERTPVAARRR